MKSQTALLYEAPHLQVVADLFLRMQRHQAEIAATVHFAARELAQKVPGEVTKVEVFNEVKDWKQRRQLPLDDDEIAQTIRSLNVLGWLDVRPSTDLPLSDDALLGV